MSNIAIMINNFNMGGTEMAMLSLIRELLNHGHKVDVFSICKSGVLLNRIPTEVNIIELKFDKPYIGRIVGVKNTVESKSIISGVKSRLTKIFKNQTSGNKLYPFLLEHVSKSKKSYDFAFDFFGYGTFTTAYVAECINAKKKATWFHDEKLDPMDRSRFYFEKFDKLYCVSDTVKNKVLERYPDYREKVETLLNFVDAQEIIDKSNENYKDDKYLGNIKLLSIGRLNIQKGFDYAVQISSVLKSHSYKFDWYIIGEGGERKKLEQLIEKYNVNDCFHLLGLKKNPYPYLKDCDIYIQPSRHEGYGLTLLEARILCRPIVASDIIVFHEQINNGINGYLCSSIDDYVMRIEELLADNSKRNQFTKFLCENPIDFKQEYKKLDFFLKS